MTIRLFRSQIPGSRVLLGPKATEFMFDAVGFLELDALKYKAEIAELDEVVGKPGVPIFTADQRPNTVLTEPTDPSKIVTDAEAPVDPVQRVLMGQAAASAPSNVATGVLSSAQLRQK